MNIHVLYRIDQHHTLQLNKYTTELTQQWPTKQSYYNISAFCLILLNTLPRLLFFQSFSVIESDVWVIQFCCSIKLFMWNNECMKMRWHCHSHCHLKKSSNVLASFLWFFICMENKWTNISISIGSFIFHIYNIFYHNY